MHCLPHCPSITWFLLILGIILIAFAFAFFQLFQPTIKDALREMEEEGDVMIDDGGEAYVYLSGSLVRVVGLMLGEFTPDIFENSASASLGVFLLVCYMLITPIILLNALIAIMGDSYERVILNVSAEWRCEQAKILLEFEQLLYPEQRKDPRMFPTWVHVLQPKAIGEGNGEAESQQQTQWAGRAGELKNFVRSELKESQAQLDVKLEKAQSQLDKQLKESEQELSKTVKSAIADLSKKLDMVLKVHAPIDQAVRPTTSQRNWPSNDHWRETMPLMTSRFLFGGCREQAEGHEDISTDATTQPPPPPPLQKAESDKAGQLQIQV